MAEYRISGVWKNTNDVITHYAIHTVKENSTTLAAKVTKAKAIKLVENSQNTTKTWVWNYKTSFWKVGETVGVVKGKNGKYLRSNPDDSSTNNLAHLIDFDWIK